MADKNGKVVSVTTPVIAYSFSFNLDQTRENLNNVVVQFHVPVDEPEARINAILDKVVGTVERQKAAYVLETLRKEIELNKRALVQAKADLAGIHEANQKEHLASGKKGAYKPTGVQATRIQQAKDNFDRMQQMIDRQMLMAQQLEEKRGVAGPTAS